MVGTVLGLGEKAVNKIGVVSALLAPQSSAGNKEEKKLLYSLISILRGANTGSWGRRIFPE